MRYRQLGRSGLTVSVLGLGCIEFGRSSDLSAARALVSEALDAGITLFDTANSYGEGESERILGQALGVNRDRVVISTKFGSDRQRLADNASGSRRYIRRAVEECLSRLDTDYIDLYQLHHRDAATPLAETLGALDELIREGKVRYIGCSNFAAWQLVEADWIARTANINRFVSVTREYGLLSREIEHDVIPVCESYGIGLLPWRPLGSGLLADRFRPGDRLPDKVAAQFDDGVFDRLEALKRFGEERGIGLLDVAIGGLAGFPAVSSVLVGSGNPEHLRANASASEWIPTAEDVSELRRILDGRDAPDSADRPSRQAG